MERVRGTANISLNEAGKAQIEEAKNLLKKLGGLDLLYFSDLRRCVQTAKILAPAVMHEINLGEKLDPWHLGSFEGKPVEEVKDKLEYYIYHPDEIVPGKGYHAIGESFTHFKERFLSVISHLLKASANKKIGVVVNYRTLTLTKSWLMAGAKGLDIVSSGMFSPEQTGEIVYIDPSEKYPIQINQDSHTQLKNGLYLIRHGETEWNESAFSSNANPTSGSGS